MTVLHIDDYVPNLLSMEVALGPLEVRLLSTTCPLAALLVLGEEEVHLVLTDLRMEPLSGLGFVRSLRAEPRTQRVPVVVVSGVDERDPELQSVLSYPEVHFVAKPFAPQELRLRIAGLLER